MDSNACRAREVERKVWRDNDSLLRSLLLKTLQLVIGRFCCVNPVKARGSGAVSLLALEQPSSEVAPTTLLPVGQALSSQNVSNRTTS